MIKDDYFVDVDIVNNKMIRHYRDKGYNFIVGDTIKVKSTDLPHASRKEVKFICDYCGEEFFMVLKTRNNNMKKQIIKKDACKCCKTRKTEESNLIKYNAKNVFQNEEIRKKHKETMMNKYGVEYVSQIEDFSDKCKKTNLERYGAEYYTQTDEYKKNCKEVWDNKSDEEIEDINKRRRETLLSKYGEDNPLKVESIKLKMINTNIERYGYENVFQNEEIKDKSRQTNMEKYGVEYYSQSEECRKFLSENWKKFSTEKKDRIIKMRKQTSLEKYGVVSYTQTDEYLERVKKTNMKKYGVEFVLQSEEVRAKAYDTFNKNGTMPCSIQQKYLHNLIGGELNYFTGKCFLDIAFPDDMIYVEYDGGGHDLSIKLNKMTQEEFNRKEMNRYFALKKQGWKLIRIKSNQDMLPSDEEIINLINRTKEVLKDNNWVEINFNNQTFITYNNTEILKLNLRRIYKEKEVC